MGGNFTSVGGTPRSRIARVQNDLATQTLSVLSSSHVQWLRGGAAAEVQHVTYEVSPNGGGTWTSLGTGTRITGGWERTGLTLPASGQIRARGRTTGGYTTASFGLVERVVTYSLPGAPTITGEIATEIGLDGATLHATVDTKGAATTAFFQYGLSPTSLSTNTANQQIGTGAAAAVRAPITSLAAQTTYHFRLVATNAAGTSNGPVQSFTTPRQPPTVVTGAVTGIGAAGAVLNGTVNPRGESTTAFFEYGTSPTALLSKTGNLSAGSGTSEVALNSSISGLTDNTTYFFRLVATNVIGTSVGELQSFSTLPLPTSTTGAATGTGTTGGTLNGTVNPNGVSTTAFFHYGTSAASLTNSTASQTVGSGTSATALSASITGLTANGIY